MRHGPAARVQGAGAGGRRRDARSLLVRRGGAHLARGAGAGGQVRPPLGQPRAARPTWRATPPRSARKVHLLSVVGNDEPGKRLAQLAEGGRRQAHLHRDASIETTVKLRVIGPRNHQLLRIDFERTPSHEVLLDKLAEYRRLLGGLRRRGAVRLRQGRPHAHREDDRARARDRESRCWSIPRATTTRATRARPSSRPTAPNCGRWSAPGRTTASSPPRRTRCGAGSGLEALLVTLERGRDEAVPGRLRSGTKRPRRAKCPT